MIVTKKQRELIKKIYERAKKMDIIHPSDDMTDVMMDLESAALHFNLRLEDMLNANDFNFVHDFIGISNNIERDEFPCKNFGWFVPRFAGK